MIIPAPLSLRPSLSLLCALVLAACSGGGDGPPTGPPVQSGPRAVAVAGGNDQSASAGTALPQPLVARVTDAAGKPVPRVAVTWQVTAGGGSIAPAGAETDAAGEARAHWTLGTTAGTNTATATVSGLTPAAFSASGAAGPADAVTVSPDSVTLELDARRQISASARDRYGNAIAGRAFQWSSTQSGVASVDAAGMVMAQAAGTTLVIATLEGKSDTTTVRVVAPALTFASVAGGGQHACGITPSGALYCWGSNGLQQLGRASTGESCGSLGSCSTAPLPVMDGTAFASVAAGPYGSCAVTTGKTLHCWGQVVRGPGTDNVLTPRRVADGVESVALGDNFFCYVTGDGRATCSGSNGYGQLGLGVSGPEERTGTVMGDVTFRSVVAGERHACGLTPAGAAYCWGVADRGQIGPHATTEFCNGVACSTRPVAVAESLAFTTLTAGWHHTCGLAAGGAAHCWGSNGTGQLGKGDLADARVPAAVAGGLAFRSIDAGALSVDAGHTCAVTTAGAAHCWGANTRGALGTTSGLTECSTREGNTYTCSRTPRPVEGGITFAAVAAGNLFSCGVTPRGVAYCWGENRSGQLGDRTQTDRPTPVRVSDPR